ncbi:F0F1 ATP synthase subunit B [Sphingomonas radiodurans]|nr:F0F1 ATP synthase subunit B [Sphingomonas radiodurans]WBH18318.1 F0F1 ATP synthase subunit B [Sphingomonas radiodurans]
MSPGSVEVAQNLANADRAEGMTAEGTEAEGGAHHYVDPTVLGLNGTVWVSLAMLVLFAVLIWKKVPALIVGGLDKQIADIRRQLDEAKALRAEAEALRDEYARKIADAEASAADMATQANHEAEVIVAQAKADAADLVQRRARMAEDKIAAAERAAIAEVRAKTAVAAASAAATLISQHHGAQADKALVDRTIAGLGRPN